MTRLAFVFALFLLVCAGCAPIGDINEEPSPAVRTATATTTHPGNASLEGRLKAVIEHIQQRELTASHGFWAVIHGILANGLETRLRSPLGQEVNAVEYICKGGRPRGLKLIPTRYGVDVETGGIQFDSQGHQDQFIGELAQCGMPIDREFIVDGERFRFEDFLKFAKARARVSADQELSWTLVALSQYYGTDFSWTNRHGEKLHFTDLVRYELNQPINDLRRAACGGTHRLFGLTWAYFIHRRKGGRNAGVWKQVAATIRAYHKRAREMQNPDGTFSTKYFFERANSRDLVQRIGSTGHIFEWLALSLPDRELTAPWVEDAANALCKLILDNRADNLESGALYHAAHGLRMYYQRRFGDESSGPPVFPQPPPDL